MMRKKTLGSQTKTPSQNSSLATMFIARRAIASIAAGTQPSTTVSKAYLSTAFERAEGANEVAEARENGSDVSMETGIAARIAHTDPVKEGLFEAKHQDMAMTTDATREGQVKAAEMEETVGDTAKRSMVEGAKQVKEAALGEDEEEGPSKKSLSDDDTDSIEDLRRRAGGYDKRNG